MDTRFMRQKLLEKDAIISKLQSALATAGGAAVTIPPPTMDVSGVEAAAKEMAEVSSRLRIQRQGELFVEPEPEDGLPIPSSVPRSRRLGTGVK